MIVLVIVGLLAAFLGYVSIQPATFRIARSVVIPASRETVFSQVNDLGRMQTWSPWKKLDANATYTFSGPSDEVGGSMTWSGNKHIGAGRQTIMESRAPELVRSKVEFFRPFKGESEAEMWLERQGDQTRATWSLAGNNNFLSKLFCVFVNQDKMLGGCLEEGLEQLTAVVKVHG
jgi:hypothetical protein